MNAKTLLGMILAMVGSVAQADLFGTGTNQFSIDFVNIGHAGNLADTTGYGSVGYNYRIGQTEVSIDQFFKARAADGRIGSGNENHWNTGFRTAGNNAPASAVSWFEAATFCNWLTTGDAYTGIYQFNGSGTMTGIDRNYRNGIGLAYVLPNEDEWYKAAYFKPDGSGYSLYASGLDSTPTWGGANGWNYFNGGSVNPYPNYVWDVDAGGLEQNSTYNMMGNVQEWIETAKDGLLDDLSERRTLRGGGITSLVDELGALERLDEGPTEFSSTIGFRVAAIPEPSSVVLLVVGAGGLVAYRRARRRSIGRRG